MEKPSPSLYERVAQQHVSRFEGIYTGSVNAAALVVSSHKPGNAAKAALAASFRALGYSSLSIGWVQCATSTAAPTEPGSGTQAGPADCTAQSKSGNLFTLIEAICPLCVVSLDQQAATALSHDFNTPLPLEARTLLMGHACICFQDFDSLLSSDQGKRKAWALLKTLPKMP